MNETDLRKGIYISEELKINVHLLTTEFEVALSG